MLETWVYDCWTRGIFGNHEFWTVGPIGDYASVWVGIIILVARVIHFEYSYDFSLLHTRSGYFLEQGCSPRVRIRSRQLD